MVRYGPNEHDVLIIGGGGAGLCDAIASIETDPSLNVAVLSKVYPMRSNTVSAEGGPPRIECPSVNISRWPPRERVYGR